MWGRTSSSRTSQPGSLQESVMIVADGRRAREISERMSPACMCAAHKKINLIGKGISGRKTRPIQTHDFFLPFKFHTESLLLPQIMQASGKAAQFCTALPNSAIQHRAGPWPCTTSLAHDGGSAIGMIFKVLQNSSGLMQTKWRPLMRVVVNAAPMPTPVRVLSISEPPESWLVKCCNPNM
jgi:hypothetical protein